MAVSFVVTYANESWERRVGLASHMTIRPGCHPMSYHVMSSHVMSCHPMSCFFYPTLPDKQSSTRSHSDLRILIHDP